MSSQLTKRQESILRTIGRHGGTRIMTAVDTRSAKPLVRNGYLTAHDGYYSLSDKARALLSTPVKQ